MDADKCIYFLDAGGTVGSPVLVIPNGHENAPTAVWIFKVN